MKIKVDDKEVEAVRLSIFKKYAKEILEGGKRFEIRRFTDWYVTRFTDKKKFYEIFNKERTGNAFDDVEEILDEINDLLDEHSKVKYVRFEPQGEKSWHLDVEVKSIGFESVSNEEDVKNLNEGFGGEYLGSDIIPTEDDAPLNFFFYLVLGKIVGKKNI